MKKRFFLIAAVLLMAFSNVFSQTTITGGEVSGEWLFSGSPYLVEGEINIPIDETLTIESGVMVKFNGHYKFIIYGCLLAEGASGDSITFTTDDQETGWHGLRFVDTQSNNQPQSKIRWCIVEYGKSFGTCPDNSGGGIYLGHANPLISNSTIRNNSAVNGAADWGGGGIYVEYGNPEIHDNLITNNYSGHDGGGIYCSYNSPQIYNNRIIGNEALSRGGGIATFSFASPEITNNEIIDNHAGAIGGGIYQSGGNSLIQNNVITNNFAGNGGGLACYLCNPKIYNNLITDNEAQKGAGLWNQGASPNIFNNTIIRNTAYNNGGGMINISGMAGIVIYSNPLTANNIMYENNSEEGISIYSNPGNIPVIWHNNIEGLTGNGIYGDVNEMDGNFDVDPQFDTNGEHECALSENSACIDNGINTLLISVFSLPEIDILGNERVWDGNNDGEASVDMGAYEYGSSPLGIHEGMSSCAGLYVSSRPNPFTNTTSIEYELKQPERVTLTIFDFLGKEVYQLQENQTLGKQLFLWNAERFADGVYYFRLQAGNQIVAGKLIKTD